jgi:hypothetical protein
MGDLLIAGFETMKEKHQHQPYACGVRMSDWV